MLRSVVLIIVMLNVVAMIPKKPVTIKPKALVRYDNVVYQCESIQPAKCGYSVTCGNLSFHCVSYNNIEYLW
jgi:hypothetical protein